MARLARVVVPGYPDHITQRGNRNQQTFFKSHDFQNYPKLIIKNCNWHDVQIWAYCLRTNHIHLIAVSGNKDDLRRAIGENHQEDTLLINVCHHWQGKSLARPILLGADGSVLSPGCRSLHLNPSGGCQSGQSAF